MADTAYAEGNSFYKKGDLENAKISYSRAIALERSNPKYHSNLSAVYYEQGRYLLCLAAIRNAWGALRSESPSEKRTTPLDTSDAMAVKLSLRFLKAKLNGLAAGMFTLHDRMMPNELTERGEQTVIEEDIHEFLSRANEDDWASVKNKDLQRHWNAWNHVKRVCSQHTAGDCQIASAEAQKRFRSLPIYRSTASPTLEYYFFGHDYPRSLLRGLNARDPDDQSHMDEETFATISRQSVALLFGGCGDGRHVFSTLNDFVDISLHLLMKRQNGERVVIPKLFLTILDIHPASVARLMLIFALVRKRLNTQIPTARLEIATTLFYVWSAILMPKYCEKILMTTAGDLVKELTGKSPPNLTKLWSVGDYTRERVLPVLKYWAKPLPKTTERFYEINGPIRSQDRHIHDYLQSDDALTRNERYQELTAAFSKLGWVEANKDKDLPLYNNYLGEESLHRKVGILLPPQAFLDRHPELRQYVLSNGKSRTTALVKEILKDWRPNPTLFDNATTEHPCFSTPDGYPPDARQAYNDAFDSFEGWLMLIAGWRPRVQFSWKLTSYNIMEQVFDSVGDSLKILGENGVALEFVCSELCSGIPKLVTGDLGSRPAGIPPQYLRMWLSNTPDYTGGAMGNIVYLSPYLDRSHPKAVIMYNCLLNTPSWKSLAENTFNYMYLNAADVQRFFGARIWNKNDTTYEDYGLTITTRSKEFSQTLSKNDFHQYLSNMLLRTLVCPRSHEMPRRVDEPLNLVSFFRMLTYLCRNAGCPPHWAGDFVQSMIDDTLTTTATCYTGILPVKHIPKPLSIARKVNLEPWCLEMEVILASTRNALPFSLLNPVHYDDSMKTYTTMVPATRYPYPLNPFAKAVFLVFYKLESGLIHFRDLPAQVPKVLEKKAQGIQVQFLSHQEKVDLDVGIVSWRMSSRWYEKMKGENWNMIVAQTDEWKTVSSPVSADRWVEVSS